jgi:hypothetical protein
MLSGIIWASAKSVVTVRSSRRRGTQELDVKPNGPERFDAVEDCRFDDARCRWRQDSVHGRPARIGYDIAKLALLDVDQAPGTLLGGMIAQQCSGNRRFGERAGASLLRHRQLCQCGLRVDYAIFPQVTLGVGARDLFDASYVLTDGFPEPGRSLFAVLRARY